MKLIFTFLIAINFLTQGFKAQAQDKSQRLAYLKNRIEQLEDQPGTLKEIQAIQREIDDLENAPKLEVVLPDDESPFVDGGQKPQQATVSSTPDTLDSFHENSTLVAVDYGVPKEVVDRMKHKIVASKGDVTTPAAMPAAEPMVNETPVVTAKDEIRRKREDIHAARGVMGRGLKMPKRPILKAPVKPVQKVETKPKVPKPVTHGRPKKMAHNNFVNAGPRLDTVMPVAIPKAPAKKKEIAQSNSSWGFCEKDVPYLQEQLGIKIAQLEEARNAIKRTTDGFEVQKLANNIQQLENDKLYYIKMIKSMGGTPKIRSQQSAIAQTVVPAQSQEYQIKSDLERLNQAEKVVRHKIRITKDPRALTALGASLENIQNQKKLLKASAKDTGALDATQVYEAPHVYTPEKPKETPKVPEVPVTPMPTQPAKEEKTNWRATARQAAGYEVEERVDDDDVIKSAPQKPLWADTPHARYEERPQRYQSKGRGVSQSEARQIAKAWLSR